MALESIFERAGRVDAALDRLLPPPARHPARIHRAMRYSVFAGGKRLRPLLVAHAFLACRGRGEAIWDIAAAVEMVHVYSLVHDDLPAMDDDDFRRGRPTLHRRFDEATAVLAGDALLTRAFEVAACRSPARAALPILRELARAAGTEGMIGGQVLDLAAQGRRPDRKRVAEIHRRKTGALIAASCRIGGLAAGATRAEIHRLDRYGRSLGLAFQIVDDILDETGDAQTLGKPVRRDRENGKMTYPRAVGLKRAREEAGRLVRRACLALEAFGERALPLREIARCVLARTR